MKITQVCGNALYSIRFVEFIKSDGRVLEAYFELIKRPYKCVGIFTSVEAAKAEMKRLTDLHEQLVNNAISHRQKEKVMQGN